MAFVILPSRNLAQSRIRTFTSRQLVLVGTLTLAIAAGSGFAAGYVLKPPRIEQVVVEAPSAPLPPEQESGPLIERLAELSARLIRLESEAMALGRNLSAPAEPPGKPAPPAAKAAPAAGAALETGPEEGGYAEHELGSALGGPLQPPLVEGLGSEWLGGGLAAGLDVLARDLDRVEMVLSVLDDAATDRNNAFMAFPTRSPVPGYGLTSSFGNRLDPFNRRLAFHKGVDYPAPPGTPILASGGGKVVEAGFHSEYGRRVDIDHGNGLVTRYAHASRLLVEVGDVVVPGQKIALIGSSGRSTGPHLHFEVWRNGEVVNPRRYLLAGQTE